MEICPVCAGHVWDSLPNPCDDRAVMSDLRVVHEPLDKWSCRACGCVRRRPGSRVDTRFFASGYGLYDRAPGSPRETTRQGAYATWIAAQCPSAPASVIDVGCGNGSLLLELRSRWPHASLRGLDPSRESVARAREAGVDAVAAGLGDRPLDPAELVVNVNVIEHTADPAGFVSALAAALAPGAMVVMICPDGGRPWGELVFADHLSSLTREHLAHLCRKAGLEVIAAHCAPADLGPFQMVIGRRSCGFPRGSDLEAVDGGGLAQEKADYLRRWRSLDDRLAERAGGAELVCFGAGEAAGLLRAYAPDTWSAVSTCVADAPETDAFGNIPVLDYAMLPAASVLLGVRPASQGEVAARLGRDGHRVIRWDDVIPA